MKSHFLVLSFILFIIFSACNNPQVKKAGNDEIAEKSDSAKTLHTAVYLFDKSEKEVVDSLRKYHLIELADSCMKFFYVVNCMEKANDSFWCKGNALTIGESNIRITGFIDRGLDKKQILFGVFFNDSIPCSMELKTTVGIPIGFTVSVKQKKVVDVMIGEHSNMYFSDYKKYYDSLVVSTSYKTYLNSRGSSIHPTFKRLISD